MQEGRKECRKERNQPKGQNSSKELGMVEQMSVDHPFRPNPTLPFTKHPASEGDLPAAAFLAAAPAIATHDDVPFGNAYCVLRIASKSSSGSTDSTASQGGEDGPDMKGHWPFVVRSDTGRTF